MIAECGMRIEKKRRQKAVGYVGCTAFRLLPSVLLIRNSSMRCPEVFPGRPSRPEAFRDRPASHGMLQRPALQRSGKLLGRLFAFCPEGFLGRLRSVLGLSCQYLL